VSPKELVKQNAPRRDEDVGQRCSSGWWERGVGITVRMVVAIAAMVAE
jgi:hypothetical protein